MLTSQSRVLLGKFRHINVRNYTAPLKDMKFSSTTCITSPRRTRNKRRLAVRTLLRT